MDAIWIILISAFVASYVVLCFRVWEYSRKFHRERGLNESMALRAVGYRRLSNAILTFSIDDEPLLRGSLSDLHGVAAFAGYIENDDPNRAYDFLSAPAPLDVQCNLGGRRLSLTLENAPESSERKHPESAWCPDPAKCVRCAAEELGLSAHVHRDDEQ